MTGAALAELSKANERIDAGRAKDSDYLDASRYNGYVLGVSDSTNAVGLTCIPLGTTTTQITAITAKFLRENPDKWGATGSDNVFWALSAPFPCAKYK